MSLSVSFAKLNLILSIMFCFFVPLAGEFGVILLIGRVYFVFAQALLWICLIGGWAQKLGKRITDLESHPTCCYLVNLEAQE